MRATHIGLCIAILLAALVMPATARAESIIVDASTGNEITIAIVTAQSGASSVEYLVLPNSKLSLPQSDQETRLSIKDNFSENIRYYAVVEAKATPFTIIAHPAGTLLLQVKDDRDNLVSRGAVTITCPSRQESTTTDHAGLLRIVLPAEDCIVSVAAHDRASSGTYRIAQGITLPVNLTLNGTVVNGGSTFAEKGSENIMIILAVLGIALVIVLFVFHRSRLRQRGAPAGSHDKNAPIKASLTAKERTIVDQLLACGGKATLSSLRAHAKMPRTSLLRTLEGLEHRSVVIKRSEHGKVVVELAKR